MYSLIQYIIHKLRLIVWTIFVMFIVHWTETKTKKKGKDFEVDIFRTNTSRGNYDVETATKSVTRRKHHKS